MLLSTSLSSGPKQASAEIQGPHIPTPTVIACSSDERGNIKNKTTLIPTVVSTRLATHKRWGSCPRKVLLPQATRCNLKVQPVEESENDTVLCRKFFKCCQEAMPTGVSGNVAQTSVVASSFSSSCLLIAAFDMFWIPIWFTICWREQSLNSPELCLALNSCKESLGLIPGSDHIVYLAAHVRIELCTNMRL